MSCLVPFKSSAVSFAPTVQIAKVLHLVDFSDEEAAACWYGEDEVAASRTERATTLMLMESGTTSVDGNQVTSRGLELFTKEGKARKQLHVEEVWDTVLNEQDRQWDADIDEPYLIAGACLQVTRKSKEVARMMGKADERQVTKCQQENHSYLSPQKNVAKTKAVARRPYDAGLLVSPPKSKYHLLGLSSRAA